MGEPIIPFTPQQQAWLYPLIFTNKDIQMETDDEL